MPKDFSHNSHPRIIGGGKEATLPIYDVTPFTMLDFPGKCAAIIWFSGCNMRCRYCHNPQIVKGKGTRNINNVLEFLKKRRGLLDAVVLSGGEASIYPGLSAFVREVKAMGYSIKLDTNGLRPDVVQDFLKHGLLDYIALDYKAPPEKFKAVTGVDKFKDFEKTLDLLCAQKAIPFEVRTTVHTALMNEEDIKDIMDDLDRREYRGAYYVQNYTSNVGSTLGFLATQKYELNISALPQSRVFSTEFRNFS